MRFKFSRCAFSFGIAPGGGIETLNADTRTDVGGRTECDDERVEGTLETDGRTDGRER